MRPSPENRSARKTHWRERNSEMTNDQRPRNPGPISLDDATPFLLEFGLVNPAWVIDGELTVSSAARRNRNLRVEGPKGTGFLIKQPDDWAAGGYRTLRSEAAFYAFCQEEPAAAAMRRIVPYLSYFEPDSPLLALELVPNAATLWAYYQAPEVKDLPVDVAHAVGHTLGTAHQIFRQRELLDHPRLAWLSTAVPWVMTVHKPVPELLASLSPANVQTIHLLQSNQGLAVRLDRLRQEWRHDTLIHGDVKSDNILVWRSAHDANIEIRLADWEMVQRGDPAWDLAGALQDCIDFWLSSMPLSDEMPMQKRVARAGYPLHVVQRSIRSLWSGYCAATAPSHREAENLLRRAVESSAARMIQTAYEISYHSPELLPRSVVLLQVGANILAEPERARVELYGIPMTMAS
jgi:Phosphotransferase enzyme family